MTTATVLPSDRITSQRRSILQSILTSNECTLVFDVPEKVQKTYLKANCTKTELGYVSSRSLPEQVFLCIAKKVAHQPQRTRFVDKCLPINRTHYAKTQVPWLRDSTFFLGERLHRSPTRDEAASEYLVNGEAIRYKLWYIFNFPDNIVVEL